MSNKQTGTNNLLEWKKKHPEGPGFRHGAYSRHFRERYTDGRTREGKALQAVVQGIADDLGGMENLSQGQLLLMDRIKEKLIVLWQIGQYVDKQPSSVLPSGELLGCLGKNYVSYSEGLRRDVTTLYALAARKPSNVTDLAAYLKSKKREPEE